MERSQRTRKDFYLQGKSTVVVIGAASGVKHPTPSPAQHHPPAFPLGKGRKIPPQPKQSAPSAALPASCRRVILQVAQLRCGGDPRPLPEMPPPPPPGAAMPAAEPSPGSAALGTAAGRARGGGSAVSPRPRSAPLSAPPPAPGCGAGVGAGGSAPSSGRRRRRWRRRRRRKAAP